MFEKLRMNYSSPPPKVVMYYDRQSVAELTYLRGRYQFRYLEQFRELGLAPLPGLPEIAKRYESADLFAFFEERIPDMRRPEIRQLISTKKLDESNKLALLAGLSRFSVTDSYEIREDSNQAA